MYAAAALDDVGPPMVSEDDEADRVEVIVGGVVDAGDVHAAMDDEAVLHRVLAGRPELFVGLHGAVVALAAREGVEASGRHALAPVLVSAALRTRGAGSSSASAAPIRCGR
ncbi:hypothetical protein [Streptomyces sennicomposti]